MSPAGVMCDVHEAYEATRPSSASDMSCSASIEPQSDSTSRSRGLSGGGDAIMTTVRVPSHAISWRAGSTPQSTGVRTSGTPPGSTPMCRSISARASPASKPPAMISVRFAGTYARRCSSRSPSSGASASPPRISAESRP